VSLLEVAGISKSFGGLRAVDDVGFDVRSGSIKAVIGPNGAGKTTLFNLIFGSSIPDKGTVTFAGQKMAGGGPRRRVTTGMARTFQHIRLFPQMTALENVMVGAHTRGRAGFLASLFPLPQTWKEERFIREQALAAMAFMGIESLAASNATHWPMASSEPSSWPAPWPASRGCSCWTSPQRASTCARPSSWGS
jgi:branched-chain amino acid transport system ATP-binding protein